MKAQIDVVVIGVNSEKTLEKCIDSILNSDYPKEKIKIFYSDGGSIDKSLEIARKYKGINVIELHLDHPTPGRQRNEGWRSGKGEFVQFLDSDTIMDEKWLSLAIEGFANEKIGAICGNRVELYPEASLYNWLGNLEWNPEHGVVEAFGGDVMIRREVLENTNGYLDDLVAGEDPELSFRVREKGYNILRMDVLMTKHDLGMKKFKQYWKRGYRTGYAFAEVNKIHFSMWSQDVKRIKIRGVAFLIMILSIPLFIVSKYIILLFSISAFVALRPRIMLVKYFQQELNLIKKDAEKYAWHASIVVLPQFVGIVRFYLGKLLKKPLKNKVKKLKTGGII